MTFLELLNRSREIDCELIVAGEYMPATLVWAAGDRILPDGIEVFKGLVEAECEFNKDKDLVIHCTDRDLGEKFVMAAAGYISVAQYDRYFEDGERIIEEMILTRYGGMQDSDYEYEHLDHGEGDLIIRKYQVDGRTISIDLDNDGTFSVWEKDAPIDDDSEHYFLEHDGMTMEDFK